MYFWSLGISLYLELFCFLSFITIVLRNLCSGTHRRNQHMLLVVFHPFFPCFLSCLVVCFLHLNPGVFAAGATLSFEEISDSPVDGLKSLKFLFLSLQTSHVIRQLRYHSDRRPRQRPQGLKIYQRSVFNLTSKLFLLLFLRNHPFIGLQGPSKHQGLDLRERIKYR